MADDSETRPREVELFHQAVALFERQVKVQEAPPSFAERWGVLIGAGGIIVTLVISLIQMRTAQEQFERTLRENQYSDIVDGLASESVGVQVNSIRSLIQYVEDQENFAGDDEARRQAAENAVQTLDAFIEDESTTPGRQGLTDFRDPQPVVVSRAVRQLRDLLKQDAFSDIAVDLSRGNFHGVDLPDLELDGKLFAVGADFRLARVTGWELRGDADLTAAFFTCANLRKAELGSADVTSADFTGADLGGADLSGVRGLDPLQLRGARIRKHTQLPPGVDPPPQDSWGVQGEDEWVPTTACRDLVETMTHLVGGSEYSPRFSCPGKGADPARERLSDDEFAALVRVCGARERSAGR